MERIEAWKRLHPREDPEVVIKTMNPSMGPLSVATVHAGFDWDDGRFFLKTEEDICKAVTVTNDEIRERGIEFATNTHEKLGFEYPHRRRDAWIDGFVEGLREGIRKLAEKNTVKPIEDNSSDDVGRFGD